MQRSLRSCVPLALLVLAACSPGEAPQPAPQDEAAAPVPQTDGPAPSPAQAAIAAPAPEQKCTDEPRTDANDKRPRCGGIGPAPPAARAYRITLDNGESFTACDVTRPFSGKIGGGMITLGFTPADDRNGDMAFHFANAGGMADTSYRYTLSGPEDTLTASFQSTGAVRGQGSGRTVSAGVRKQSFTATWTRIEDCDK